MTIGVVGKQTVPDALLGCWRRNWIRFGDDGEHESDVAVIWLQTASGMGDIRIDPRQTPTETDSSCGITVVDDSATPYPTAEWLDGETGFSQQAVPSFPEKGWLDWHSDTLMYERAPSGAYVEEWQKLPRSGPVVEHYVALDAPTVTNLYVAGDHRLLAVARHDGEPLHEFSYGIGQVELSTVQDRVGQALEFNFAWTLVSRRAMK